MSETLSQLRFLFFLLLILGFTVGLVSQKRLTKFIAGMIFMPVLLGLMVHYIQAFRTSLDPVASWVFTIGILVAGLLLALRFLLGKDVWHSVVGDLIYDVLKWLFFAPFRFLRWLCQRFFNRAR